ncbi:hypothetical protein CQ014_22135 [Pseudomonas lurida]|nr:hypothetical protein CQ002_21710 [Pseudomonas sp. MYb13]PRA18107.1 hypothetical protein CQ004_23540 [Pseudomonas lurida]PRA31009.1 hypothetical protein CQ005_21775 [Pseudomonas lurida]PRB97161.1 hypothetical protein CQ014_22135 [Pseudomonas lurida]PRC25870.1 hypothetical protein CQ000_16425 [Pseudomonas lurida]
MAEYLLSQREINVVSLSRLKLVGDGLHDLGLVLGDRSELAEHSVFTRRIFRKSAYRAKPDVTQWIVSVLVGVTNMGDFVAYHFAAHYWRHEVSSGCEQEGLSVFRLRI